MNHCVEIQIIHMQLCSRWNDLSSHHTSIFLWFLVVAYPLLEVQDAANYFACRGGLA